MAELSFPDPPLADSELVLRPFQDADMRAITAACQDPEIPRFTHVPSPYREEDARRFLALAEQGRTEGRELHLAIATTAEQRLAGTIGLEAGSDPGIAEVGYWLAPGARGRGLAARAVRLLSRWACGELGTRRVELLAHPDNAASQRVAETAGFTREGLLRAYRERKGRREDLWMFSLLPADLGLD